MPRLGVLGLVLLAMSQCCCFSGLAKFAQRQPSTMVLLRHGEREDYMAQKAAGAVRSSLSVFLESHQAKFSGFQRYCSTEYIMHTLLVSKLVHHISPLILLVKPEILMVYSNV